METTVTGLFDDAAAAMRAQAVLRRDGVGDEAIAVITAATANRHELLGAETADVARGAALGAAVGAVGMAIGGVAMSVPPIALFALHPALAALLFGGLGAGAGTAIGVLIGSATGHQVQEEYEAHIDSGAVLLAVHTDRAHAAAVQRQLAECGGRMLSTSVHGKRGPRVGRTA